MIGDKQGFRAMVDEFIKQYPGLFPPEIEQGYQLYGLARPSVKMPDIRLRRICLKMPDEQDRLPVYTVTPSFILPYMTGYADDVEKALFLRRFNVPF